MKPSRYGIFLAVVLILTFLNLSPRLLSPKVKIDDVREPPFDSRRVETYSKGELAMYLNGADSFGLNKEELLIILKQMERFEQATAFNACKTCNKNLEALAELLADVQEEARKERKERKVSEKIAGYKEDANQIVAIFSAIGLFFIDRKKRRGMGETEKYDSMISTLQFLTCVVLVLLNFAPRFF